MRDNRAKSTYGQIETTPGNRSATLPANFPSIKSMPSINVIDLLQLLDKALNSLIRLKHMKYKVVNVSSRVLSVVSAIVSQLLTYE